MSDTNTTPVGPAKRKRGNRKKQERKFSVSDAVLTGLVKNPAGTPLAGETVTLVQSGATATTNAEGRYEISTKTVGSVTLRVTAGAPPVNYEITADIPEDHEGITITVDDIVVG